METNRRTQGRSGACSSLKFNSKTDQILLKMYVPLAGRGLFSFGRDVWRHFRRDCQGQCSRGHHSGPWAQRTVAEA